MHLYKIIRYVRNYMKNQLNNEQTYELVLIKMMEERESVFVGGLMALVFDPIESNRSAMLDLLEAIGGHFFGLCKPFFDLLLRSPFILLAVLLGGAVVIVAAISGLRVPLVCP
uniref:Uncharacterized protein n=1 Tax=Opuntia streptacantha TaxID=393608 RepID=A0A7C9DMS3_OPUST